MIGENIRRARKARGLSQEELAAKLDVVRQTVSKWENSLSVPDADVLVKLSRLLGVAVDELLDLAPPDSGEDERLRLRAELDRLEEQRRRAARAGRVRGLILLLTFAALLLALSAQSGAVSIALAAGCVLAALVILYKNLSLLTGPATPTPGLGALKLTTIFDIAAVVLASAAAVLFRTRATGFSGETERLLALAIISAVILFSGWISPRLPFNRHTGLRLPWTVTDEQTWNVAHRVLGIVACPLALLYIAAALTVENFDAVTLTAVALWVGIPGLISLAFWWRKFH